MSWLASLSPQLGRLLTQQTPSHDHLSCETQLCFWCGFPPCWFLHLSLPAVHLSPSTVCTTRYSWRSSQCSPKRSWIPMTQLADTWIVDSQRLLNRAMESDRKLRLRVLEVIHKIAITEFDLQLPALLQVLPEPNVRFDPPVLLVLCSNRSSNDFAPGPDVLLVGCWDASRLAHSAAARLSKAFVSRTSATQCGVFQSTTPCSCNDCRRNTPRVWIYLSLCASCA